MNSSMKDEKQWFPPDRHCGHSQTVIARRTLSDGRNQYGAWCQGCGKWRAVATNHVPVFGTIVKYDPDLHHDFWEQQSKVLDAERKSRTAEWWEKYNEYLQSDKWKYKRKRVLKRDCNLCQACLIRNATQVHHLTYAHVFDEPLFDLVSICDVCHEVLHGNKEC